MSDRHITWDNFEESFIKPGDPAVHPVHGNPKVTFFVDRNAGRMGLHIYHNEPLSVDPSIHEQISLHVLKDGNYHVLEASVSERDLYEAFYAVMIKIADQVQLHGIAGADAINNAITDFQRLIQKRGLMSDDKVIGLWGELWFYRNLVKRYGNKVLNSWKGPEKAIHDFRFSDYEFEVKTTRKEERRHIISRLSQMEESPGRYLYLVSIQVIPSGPGAGESLPDMVKSVHDSLVLGGGNLNEFRKKLDREGYSDQDAGYYQDRFTLRSEPVIVLVNDKTPKITSSIIQNSLGKALSARINDVHYEVNISGMGYPESSEEYRTILESLGESS